MNNKEYYYKTREIFAKDSKIFPFIKPGHKLYYTVYMTDDLEKTGIDALELSVRSFNCLKRAGLNTIGQLCYRVHEKGDLNTIRNCGKKSVIEIMDKLFAYHYYQLDSEQRDNYLRETILKNENINNHSN